MESAFLGGFRSTIKRQAVRLYDLLVTRASGGDATKGKIDAARALGLPVIMLRRPAPPPGNTAETIDAALDWLIHEMKN